MTAVTTEAPANSGEHQENKADAEQDFEATMLAALEISSYDLEVLKRYLLSILWVPISTDEEAIADAVFRFRKSYKRAGCNYHNVFPENKRLVRLFEVWATVEIEEWETEFEFAELSPRENHNLELQRETAKYNAIRTLFAHLADRESRKRGKAGKSS